MINKYIHIYMSIFTKNIKDNHIKNYNIEKIMNDLYSKIINSLNEKDINNFISSYNEHELTLIYLTNLAIYQNVEFDLNIYINKIKTNKEIIKYVMKNMKYPEIRYIGKNISPYILYNKKLKTEDIDTVLLIIKQNNILQTKQNLEKFVELIIYRYASSKNNKYRNFHEFYINNFTQIDDMDDFKTFFNDIPEATSIICYSVDEKIKPIPVIHLKNIILYILEKMNYSKKKLNQDKTNSDIIYTINIDDNIIDVIIDPTKPSGIYHLKYNLVNINNIETKNHIIIYFNTKIINNLSLLLTFIHYLTISLKLINFKPNNIYELNNTHDMENYFYDTFVYFLEYIKPQINVDKSYNKYIVDLFKFYYMYAFYDYVLYADQTIVKMLIEDLQNSYKIITDVLDEMQQMFNFKNMVNYPPFNVGIEDNINNIIYYSFENPNYFKLYDFVKALMKVFNIKKINHFDKVFLKCIDAKIVSNVIKIEKSKPVINKVECEFGETDVHMDDYILNI